MKATELNPELAREFEDTPKLQAGENLCVIGTEFGNTQKQNIPYVLIDTTHGKRFTTGAKVIGQLKSDFYQNLIKEAVGKNSGLDILSETVKAVPSGRDMLSINIFNTA